MNSFEINKMIGGALGTVFVLFSINLLGDAIFHSPAPEKAGYALAGAEEGHGGGEAAGGGAEAAGPEPIAALLAGASAEAGAAVFKKCTSCHTIEKGGANKVGPNLYGVVGRAVGSHEGFSYSAGMKTFAEGGKTWDYDQLNGFLASPKGWVKGTAMGFAGVKKTDERAALVAFLRSMADAPLPLPEAGAAPAAAAPAAEPAKVN